MIRLNGILNKVYESMQGSEVAMDYDQRHGVDSLSILTVTNDERADLIASHLEERISGKVVVEIGGGIGLLAFHLSQYAKRVFVIEANPAWSHVYVAFLYATKPKNVTFIFGAADEVADQIRGDVALFCTHSDSRGMGRVASRFAPEVIDVYGEIVGGMDAGPLWNILRMGKALGIPAAAPERSPSGHCTACGAKDHGASWHDTPASPQSFTTTRRP